VAFNEALALRRRQGQHERLIRNAAWDSAKESVLPDDVVQKSEVVSGVCRAMEDLPPEQAAVVRMRIYEQKKFAEIARQLGLPLGTVLTRMRLAMRTLEAKFQGWQR
jgi:RNA polymerase sigma-70 factor (ECF subfamily)